jgi:hypothetical protein
VRIQTNLFYHGPGHAFILWCCPGFPGDFKNTQFSSKPVSKPEKVRKPVPKASKKTRTNRPSNRQKKTILAKTWFLQYLPHENLVPRAQIPKKSTTKSMQKVTWKQAPKKKH